MEINHPENHLKDMQMTLLPLQDGEAGIIYAESS
jgi:hypothetical protein